MSKGNAFASCYTDYNSLKQEKICASTEKAVRFQTHKMIGIAGAGFEIIDLCSCNSTTKFSQTYLDIKDWRKWIKLFGGGLNSFKSNRVFYKFLKKVLK